METLSGEKEQGVVAGGGEKLTVIDRHIRLIVGLLEERGGSIGVTELVEDVLPTHNVTVDELRTALDWGFKRGSFELEDAATRLSIPKN